MPMRITRVTDHMLKNSAALRVAAVAFLWLPMSAFFGFMLMDAARYFWGVPHAQGLFYVFAPGFLAMEAFLLRMDGRAIRDWYAQHDAWWRTIKSGEFAAWYTKNYAARGLHVG